MKDFISSYLLSLWNNAELAYRQAILSFIETKKSEPLLDVGCDNGEWTMVVANHAGVKISNVYAIELVKNRYKKAINRRIMVKPSDLNKKWPFRANTFQCIHANQVIEHIWNLDLFVAEIYRLLKPDGYAIVATENLASWHNIFPLILGFQPFSCTNISVKGIVGNPIHMNTISRPTETSWQHTRVLSYAGFQDIFRLHGFIIEKYVGAGYHPLPCIFMKIASYFDPRHTAFLVLKVRKPMI